MDKLKCLITGLKNEDGLDSFWEGAINDSRFGSIPTISFTAAKKVFPSPSKAG